MRGRPRKGVTSITGEEARQFKAEQMDTNYPTDELQKKSTPKYLTFSDEDGRRFTKDIVKIPLFSRPELTKYTDSQSKIRRTDELAALLAPLHGMYVGFDNKVGEETLIVLEDKVTEVKQLLGIGEANV